MLNFFLFVISLFKMAPKGSAEGCVVLLSAVLCLRDNLHVLGKFHSAIRYSGCEFKINNTAVYTK